MTLVVQLFGGPCAGKSTTRAGVFHKLKLQGLNVEEVTEYAKELTWEKRHVALGCQAYVFGKQYRNVERLLGQVQVVVTDSPVLLSAVYAPDNYPVSFHQFVLDMFNRLDSLNFYVRRVKPYNPVGRNQDESGARKIDEEVWMWLSQHGIPFQTVDGDEEAVEKIVGEVNRCMLMRSS